MCQQQAEEVEEVLEGAVQYDDDELEARQLGFVTVHCKYAPHTSETPPNRSLMLLLFCGCTVGHQPRKYGKVREFESGQGKVGENCKSGKLGREFIRHI